MRQEKSEVVRRPGRRRAPRGGNSVSFEMTDSGVNLRKVFQCAGLAPVDRVVFGARGGLLSEIAEFWPEMARPAGLEPATPGLEGRCSIQLSYGRVDGMLLEA